MLRWWNAQYFSTYLDGVVLDALQRAQLAVEFHESEWIT